MDNVFFPKTIDLRITGFCNLYCRYCFGPSRETKHVDVNKLIDLLEDLSKLNVKNIVITGGEPLLLNEIGDIVKKAKSLGLVVILSTNGLLVKENINRLYPYIDWIGLPLDGNSPNSNGKMRGENTDHFSVVLNLISFLKSNYPKINIKIGTVVSEINKNHILGILNILKKDEYRPDVWKLYQVIHKNREHYQQDSSDLTDDEFHRIVEKTRILAEKNCIKTAFLYRGERDGKYLFLDPSGDAIVIHKGKEIVIGNFFENIMQVIEKCPEYITRETLENNFDTTYPSTT